MNDLWLDRFVSHCVADQSFCVQFTGLSCIEKLNDRLCLVGYIAVDCIVLPDGSSASAHCCEDPAPLSAAQRAAALATARPSSIKRCNLLTAVCVPQYLYHAVICPLNGMRLRVVVRSSTIDVAPLVDCVRCSAFGVDRSSRPLVLTEHEHRRYVWSPNQRFPRPCVESLPLRSNCAFHLDCLQLLPFPALPVERRSDKRRRNNADQASPPLSAYALEPIIVSQPTGAIDYGSFEWRRAPLSELDSRDVALLRLAPSLAWAASIPPVYRDELCVAASLQVSAWLTTQGSTSRAVRNWGTVRKSLRINMEELGDVRAGLVIDRSPALSEYDFNYQLVAPNHVPLARLSLVTACALDRRFWLVTFVISFPVAFELSKQRGALDDVYELLISGAPLSLFFALLLGSEPNMFRVSLLGGVAPELTALDVDNVLRYAHALANSRDVFEWPRLPNAELVIFKRTVSYAAQINVLLECEATQQIDRHTVFICDWCVRAQDVMHFSSTPHLCAVPLRDVSDSAPFQRVAFMKHDDALVEQKLRSLFDPRTGVFVSGGIDVVRVETRADHDGALCAVADQVLDDEMIVYCGDEHHKQLAQATLQSILPTRRIVLVTDGIIPHAPSNRSVLCIPFAHRYTQRALADWLSTAATNRQCHRLVVIGLPLTPSSLHDGVPLRRGPSLVDDLFFATSAAIVQHVTAFASSQVDAGLRVPYLRAWSGKGDFLRRLEAQLFVEEFDSLRRGTQMGRFDDATCVTFVARSPDAPKAVDTLLKKARPTDVAVLKSNDGAGDFSRMYDVLQRWCGRHFSASPCELEEEDYGIRFDGDTVVVLDRVPANLGYFVFDGWLCEPSIVATMHHARRVSQLLAEGTGSHSEQYRLVYGGERGSLFDVDVRGKWRPRRPFESTLKAHREMRALQRGCALGTVLGLMFYKPKHVVWVGEVHESLTHRLTASISSFDLTKTPYERSLINDSSNNWFDSYAVCANSALPYTLGPVVADMFVTL